MPLAVSGRSRGTDESRESLGVRDVLWNRGGAAQPICPGSAKVVARPRNQRFPVRDDFARLTSGEFHYGGQFPDDFDVDSGEARGQSG